MNEALDKIRLDVRAQCLVCGDKIMRLRPSEMLLMHLLIDAYPRPLTYHEIEEHEQWSWSSLSVILSLFRKRLRSEGFPVWVAYEDNMELAQRTRWKNEKAYRVGGIKLCIQ